MASCYLLKSSKACVESSSRKEFGPSSFDPKEPLALEGCSLSCRTYKPASACASNSFYQASPPAGDELCAGLPLCGKRLFGTQSESNVDKRSPEPVPSSE